MKLIYSDQALAMIENKTDFNKEDFEKWFIDNIPIGSNTIVSYLMFKKQQQKLIEEANKILNKEGDKNGNTKL